MQYKLYSSVTATTNAAASVKITKRGKLKAINFSLGGLAGAGSTGWFIIEISKQNTTSATTNDAPVTVLGYANFPLNGVSSSQVSNVLSMADADLDVGDTVYMNVTATGTVAAAVSLTAVLIC